MPRFVLLALTVLVVTLTSSARGELDTSAASAAKPVRVIIETPDPARIEVLVAALGGTTGPRLTGTSAVVAELPANRLDGVTAAAPVRRITGDRRIRGTLEIARATTGAQWVAERLGFDGTGVGVAIIDSGVTSRHDDLAGRIAHFADFVGVQEEPHDGYGHGTHVAGIIAGSGLDSGGARRGMAPGAHLVVLRALDDQGDGFISNAIAAIDYAVEHRVAYNIRVVNLSVAAGVYESYETDPLTLAARRAVDAGIVVVTAAGNLGVDASGQVQYAGITAPGNAPWVLTVGASDHNGTVDPADDVVAPFSSRGPTAIDLVPKPDLLAPGVGIESLAASGSLLFFARPQARIWGTVQTGTPPYLSLSGTSMAAPIVAGTIALMSEVNPALTPAEIKAILQASADPHERYSQMARGAGFLNARAAVELTRLLAANPAAAERLRQLAGSPVQEDSTQASWRR